MSKFAPLMIAAAALSTIAGCVAEGGDQADVTSQDSQLATTCENREGTNAMIAALATAIGTELHRWEITSDFYVFRGYQNQEMLGLTSLGLSQCTNGCENVKALLTFQDSHYDQMVRFGNNKLSSWSYASRVVTGYNNQKTCKAGNWCPYDAHKLTLTATAPGGCNTFFTYNATTPSGGALANPARLSNALLWTTGNGPNPYIAFNYTASTVSIDPDGGMANPDSGGATTVSGTTGTAGSGAGGGSSGPPVTTWGCQITNPMAQPIPALPAQPVSAGDITGKPCLCNAAAGTMFKPQPANMPKFFKCSAGN